MNNLFERYGNKAASILLALGGAHLAVSSILTPSNEAALAAFQFPDTFSFLAILGLAILGLSHQLKLVKYEEQIDELQKKLNDK